MLQKLIKEIDEELASANPNSDSLQESLTMLIEREQKLGNLDDIIIFQSPDAEIETEMENSLEYSEQIIKYKSRVNRYLSESVQIGKDEINKVPVATSEIKRSVIQKLLRINLEKFNGISRDFKNFGRNSR
ncbi:hypothetical protein CEXT_100321 [Caerostris extrusa]|uniref:Uncharacterized protein n=1 Tax=Caerostris extrusa TaxID=172846 RepID=A0AAV4NF91_CAEEX|nr:hypothetical protein CEXT_100321 [Caerostris extrusa]